MDTRTAIASIVANTTDLAQWCELQAQAIASIVANTTDLAQWCELQAQALDKVHAVTELRPMSPQECRRMVDIQRETLRRVGQHHTLMLTLLPGVVVSAPAAPIAPMVPPPVGWLRRKLRRWVG